MIILTGGAGFIGSNFLNYLNSKGLYNILIVDSIKKSNKWRTLVGKNFNDFIDKSDLFTVLDSPHVNIEAIIHLGACSSTTENDFDYLLKNNYEYSKRLFHYAVKRDVPFIYASSAASYGDGKDGFDDEIHPSRLNPMNQYGYLKNLFDYYVLNQKYSNQVVGLKFFNVYGPGEENKGEMSSVILKKYNELSSGKRPSLFKSYDSNIRDGEQMRDFIFVEDICSIIYYFLENSTISGIFNVGTENPKSFNELVHVLMGCMNIEREIDYIEFPENLKGQYQSYTKATLNKLRKIGYQKEFTSLEEGIKKYVQYLEKK